MSDDSPITFRASFPAIQSAIIISGDGSGLRVKLDIPETDLLQALSILAMRQTAFRVTIEPLANDEIQQATHNGTTTVKRTTAKRRK
jgi:hypothetical protein